jgi:hypothetical protein
VEIILQSTGVVAGEFGFVEACTKKKQEMAAWLTDHDARVRAFAESYMRLLDRRIAAYHQLCEHGRLMLRSNNALIRAALSCRQAPWIAPCSHSLP